MNAYNFHISPYDLVLLGAIFIGLTFILLLWFAKTIPHVRDQPSTLASAGSRTCESNRFLALALLTIILWMVRLLGIDPAHAATYPALAGPLQFSLALGPLIYFYSLSITQPEYYFRRKDLLHFIPLLLQQAPLFNSIMQFLATLSVIIYLYLSHRLIEKVYQKQKFNGGESHHQEFRWLNRQLAGFGFLWLLWILGMDMYHPLNLLLAVTTVWMAAAAHLRPESLVSKPTLPEELRQKGSWLKKTVKANLYYQDAELTLSSLAEKLDMHPHELSPHY